LDGDGQDPETAGDGKLAIGHHRAGIGLPDGAAELIHAAGAGAAATANRVPINRVVLRVKDGGWKENAKQGEFGCCFHRCIGVGSSADELKKWFDFMPWGAWSKI